MHLFQRQRGLLALLWGFFALTTSLSAQTVQIRTAPRPQGNYERFAPQPAYNTLLLGRLPKNWTVPANRYVLWQGPVLASKVEAMKLFTNGGITASMIPDATNPMNLPSARRGNFPGGHGTHQLSASLAQEVGSSDSRYQALLDYATQPYYVTESPDAYRFLGERSFALSIAANSNVPPAFWGTDLEDHDNKPGITGAREHFPIYVYQGAKAKITALGLNTKLFTYGTAALCGVTNHTSNRQDADIAMRVAPIEWQGNDGLFSVTEAKTQVFRDGAFVGGDKYSRMTWDNASLWQKNGDGSLKIDANSLPIYYKGIRTNVTNYGQAGYTYTYEAQYFLDMWYSELDKIVIEWRWHCNTPISGYTGNFVNMPFPLGTIDLRPGLEKLKKLSYFRDNTEMLQMWNPDINNFDPFYSTPELGIEAANSRALNPEATEFTVLMRTMLNDMLYVFGNPGNYADWVNGQANQHGGDFRGTGGQNNYAIKQRFGQFETMLNASRRGRNFPELFKVMDAKKARFVIPWRPVVRGNAVDYAEHQSNKPLVFGVKEEMGRRFWIAAAFPAQDVNNPSMERNLTWWLDDGNGKVSPSYVFTLKNRITAFEQMLLPVGWENATADMFRFKFTGLSGTTFYRTGHYNVPVSGTPTVPTAAVVSSPINYALPVN